MDNKSTYLIKNNLQTFDIFLKHNYKNIPKPNFDGFYGFYGFVYEQFASSTPNTKAPISPVSFYIDSSAAQKVIRWKQNPEGDLKGYRVYFNKVSDFEYSNSVDVGLTNNYAIPLGTTPGTEFSVTAYDNDYDGIDDIFDGNESFYANPSQNISSLVYKGTNVNNTQESSLAICALESYSIKAIGTCDSIKWNTGYTGNILTLDTLTQSNKFYFECFRYVPVLHSITSDTVFINVKPNLAILNSIHGYGSDQSFSAKKIQSSSKIKNSKIDYWAENSIEFLAGFKVENGEHFEAKIKAICVD
ncbi:3-coathanger stack domain-containing protein [Lacihabitans lacunae]|uniref:3-coathanger stack domain-containing protein n=1 Tax=Lacihabitans lacunae TaxID=1028214 RepID=A0ABV7YRD8_9BACT